MPIVTTSKGDSYNFPVYGMHGTFALSPEASLPYFATLLRIERLIDEIQVAEEISPDLQNKWSLSELFQREVNRDRVKEELVEGYLQVASKLKFFNALTVVLMPKNPDTGRVGENFLPPTDACPPIPWSAAATSDADWAKHSEARTFHLRGFQYTQIGDQARLRWDPEQVHAVVVDGQHRLVALRQFRGRDGGNALTPAQKQTTIPVIFVLLIPDLGFIRPQDAQVMSLSAVSREIFTDLNKNAKPVDRARELILDDWSVVARCVRTLVTNTTATRSQAELPLTLVRWQEPNNRFDSGYYVNSLVHLDMTLLTLLDLPVIQNPLSGKEVEGYMDACRALFNAGSDFHDGKWTLAEAYRQLYQDEENNNISPFTRLPNSFLGLAVDGFVRYHKPWITGILFGFSPYKQLLDYADEHNLVEGVFGQYQAQTKRHRDQLRQQFQKSGDEQWYEREIERHVQAIESIKGIAKSSRNNLKLVDWSFKSIFQKAMLRLAKEICFDNKELDVNLGTLQDILAVFNKLHAKGVFYLGAELDDGSPYKMMWTFIALNPASGTIRVSQRVEDNLLAALRLAYYANRKVEMDKASGTAALSARRLLKFFEAGSNRILWPECDTATTDLKSCFESKVFYNQDPNDVAPDEKRRLQRNRAVAFIKATLIDPESIDAADPDGDAG